MKLQGAIYDPGSKEVSIRFADDKGNECLELTLFKDVAEEVANAIQNAVAYKEEE